MIKIWICMLINESDYSCRWLNMMIWYLIKIKLFSDGYKIDNKIELLLIINIIID